ncbi:hypothetical protein [Bifidobacterium pseudolongum]|uniref:Uncharacterized protein n=1 Tax=Bifidobacterium pseudolongum subsp. globosum TaxID=1690 RepID=A0A4Q5ARZ1_9BIFI|nr:hypothetical protein [Bifidobacterium pseudolongum]RYQ36314.1 hypothetical protein PG2003B_1151 [Bifidobacterium pseudolongum subsp. globosum]
MSTRGYARLSNELWRSTKGRKLTKKNPSAGWLWVMSISFASDRMSDGHLSEDDVLYSLDADQQDIDFLVAEGYWIPAPDGGWDIANYAKWQNTKDEITEKRVQAAERQRRHRAKNAVVTDIPDATEPTTAPSDTPVTDMSRVTDASQNERHAPAFNQNQNQNQNTSSHEEVGDARDTTLSREGESDTIDAWAPSPACDGLVDELVAEGQPRVDLKALAREYRAKLHARGCAHYGINPTPASIDAYFRTWITTEAKKLAQQTPTASAAARTVTGRAQPDHYKPQAHVHTAYCEHVRNLMASIEHMFDRAVQDGQWGTSDYDWAAQAAADSLNQENTPEQALDAALATRKEPAR